ncbi:EI24 domain-containing protein [Ramlibacter sp.]|uniref:EI24 domain-containing protein n=1 Tax=Ramlibacter sp. TaxID=1917967 RepID=UPI00181B823E|nr:EI24 domain-containing protein [Ramlibacter sp.]MBA2674137.1 EI24 domain-containing protein [Ramlibacter sp.]
MTGLLDSFWRAVAYCLHPRVIALSFLPLIVTVAISLGLGYFYWDASLDLVRGWLESSSLLGTVGGWMQSMGLGSLRTVVAPLIVIFAVTPALVLVSLMVVALMMTPSLVGMVAERRFAGLERKHGGSFLASALWSLGSLLLAAIAMVASVPLWLIPPLIMVLPPLIWGWLTYRVMAFDALAAHASREERREVFRRHRLRLLGIGVLTGYLGAAPSIVWASGALFAAAFVILVPVAIWIYTLVFAFSSLWFAHYCLAALEQLRAERAAVPVPVRAGVVDVPLALGDERTPQPRHPPA